MMTRLKLYIAGASREAERVRRWTEIANQSSAIKIVSTWVDGAEKWSGQDDTYSSQLSARIAIQDLAELASADVVWLMVPDNLPSFGAVFEVGFAHGIGKPFVASGAMAESSIFTALGKRCSTDAEAYFYLSDLAHQYAQHAIASSLAEVP